VGHVHRDDYGSKMGMWLFLFTELILFGGCLSSMQYTDSRTRLRSSSERRNSIPWWGPSTRWAVTSSLTVAMSITAIQRDPASRRDLHNDLAFRPFDGRQTPVSQNQCRVRSKARASYGEKLPGRNRTIAQTGRVEDRIDARAVLLSLGQPDDECVGSATWRIVDVQHWTCSSVWPVNTAAPWSSITTPLAENGRWSPTNVE